MLPTMNQNGTPLWKILHPLQNSFIYSINQSINHLLIHLFNRSFVYLLIAFIKFSVIRFFLYSFIIYAFIQVHLVIHTYTVIPTAITYFFISRYQLVYLFICSLIHLHTHSLFVRSFFRSFIPSLIYSFVCLFVLHLQNQTMRPRYSSFRIIHYIFFVQCHLHLLW